MANVNEKLVEFAVTNQINLESYKNGSSRKLIVILNKLDRQLQKDILSIETDVMTKRKYNKILSLLDEYKAELKKQITSGANEENKEFVKTQFKIESTTINKALPMDWEFKNPKIGETWDSILQRPYENRTYNQHYNKWIDDHFNIIKNAIVQGEIENETMVRISRRIFGTSENRFINSLLQPSRRHLKTENNTTVNHISNITKESFYKENNDIIKGQQFVATLDTHTTLICGSLDGAIELFDKSVDQINGRKPPLHYNCRSLLVPIIKSFRELGLNVDEIPASTRESMDGQVSAKLTYNKWFDKQSAKVQKEILGPGRYKLYKDGSVKISNFTVNNSRELTLSELNALYA